MMNEALTPTEGRCRRCGICCCKGGPALHRQDRDLVVSGKIPLKYLLTIREGEPAFDNVRGVVTRTATDIIKIKGAAPDDTTCCFLDQTEVGCTIYDHRPVECRRLMCWNPEPLMAMYATDRLVRRDLLTRMPGLVDLVDEHQARCDYRRIDDLADRIKALTEDCDAAVEKLLTIIRYDQSLRQVTVERTRLDPDLLDFLFGHPLSATLRRFRLKLTRQDGKTTVVPAF